MASRFISLLATPFPTYLNHLRRPSFLHFRRLACGSRRLTVFSHRHISSPSPINSSQQQFHAQPINNNAPLDFSSFTSHPWPEWHSFISILTDNDQLPPAVEDSFVAYQELSQDFLRAASLCLHFARDRPNFIRLLSRRDIEVVVSNGTPFLFKAALETTRRMRAFLGIDGSTDRSTGQMIGTGHESQGLYYLTFSNSFTACSVTDTPDLIHKRLGHPSLSKL